MSQNLVFAPCSLPQSQFLKSTAFFTLYGGAVFAGKSYCLLGSMLPIISHPGTRAVIIRKTTKMLSGSGGLFDAAIQLYSKIDPKLKIKSRDLTLVFSTGAEIQFTYLDKPADRLNLQGREYSRICFDECQQLEFDNVFYALSRLRSTKVDYPLQAFATCNPDYDSFLRPFVEFALDDRGIPIRKEVYPQRYYVRTAKGLDWFDTLEEAQEIYGTSKESGIKSFLFVPGNIYDNPEGLKSNADYVSTIKALPRVEMERLLLGSWYARETASGYFKRDWVTLVDHFNINAHKRVRAWDLAFTEKSELNPDPDATVGLLMSKDKNSTYTVENCIRLHKRVHEVEQVIFDTAYRDGDTTVISLPLDPGATAGAYCRDLARRLSEKGFYVRLTRPEKGKMLRFLPFASVAEAGHVRVVRSDWNSEMFSEMETMDFTNKTHDDFADAASDAFFHLARELQIPDMDLSAFGTQPPAQSASQSQIPSSQGLPSESLGLPINF